MAATYLKLGSGENKPIKTPQLAAVVWPSSKKPTEASSAYTLPLEIEDPATKDLRTTEQTVVYLYLYYYYLCVPLPYFSLTLFFCLGALETVVLVECVLPC